MRRERSVSRGSLAEPGELHANSLAQRTPARLGEDQCTVLDIVLEGSFRLVKRSRCYAMNCHIIGYCSNGQMRRDLSAWRT